MNWRKILAVGTAMTAVGVFVPTPIVQKCASLVAYAIEGDGTLEYGDFLYRKGSRLEEVEEDDGTSAYEEVEYIEIFNIKDTAKGDIVIPDEIDGLKVTDVYFTDINLRNNGYLTSVTLPKYAKNVSLMYLPKKCKVKVAEGNENLYIENGFLIKKNATYYDSNTYESKKGNILLDAVEPLKGEVTVPEGIVTGAFNFAGNPDITVINLPSTVNSIHWYFCNNMPSLKAINVAEGNNTYFSYNGALGKYYDTHYDENGNWLETPVKQKRILAVPEGFEGVYRVPDGEALTFTGLSFENVSKMTGVELGKDTVFETPAGFMGCTSLETIELNGRVTSISGIEKYRGGHWDSEKQDWVEDDYITSVEVAAHMFADTKWYKDQPDGVLYCGATVIGYKGEPNGDKLDIKDGTRTIVDKAFNGLDIGEVNIPASVEYIGAYALDCPNLTAVNVDKDNLNYASDEGVVYDKAMTMMKLYPQGKTDETYTVPDGVEVIAANACDGNKFIKHVDIPDSVSTIFGWGDLGGAFKNCMSLEDINVPSGSFNTGALYNDSLKVIDLSESVSSYSGDVDDCDCDYLIFRNPQCEIMGMNKVKCIVGLENSNAKAFAEEHFIPFMLLDEYEAEIAVTTTTTVTTTTQTTTTTTATTTSSSTTAATTMVDVASVKANIVLHPPTKTEYAVGEKIDLTGGTFDADVTITFTDGTSGYAELKGCDMKNQDAMASMKVPHEGGMLIALRCVYNNANKIDNTTEGEREVTFEVRSVGGTEVDASASYTVVFKAATTTTTEQPATTATTATTTSPEGGEGSSTTAPASTTAPVSTTEPVTTTEPANADEPDMSEFYGSWLQFKAVVEGKEIEVPENELIQAVITSDHIYRTGSRESKWEPEEDGKSLLVNGMWKIRLDGDVLVFTEIDGTEYHFRHGEKPVSFGDPNNDSKIDANDASFVLVQYAKMSTGGEVTMTEAEKSAADINKDGKVDAKDASVALAYYSYLSTGGTDKLEIYLGYEEADVPV